MKGASGEPRASLLDQRTLFERDSSVGESAQKLFPLLLRLFGMELLLRSRHSVLLPVRPPVVALCSAPAAARVDQSTSGKQRELG